MADNQGTGLGPEVVEIDGQLAVQGAAAVEKAKVSKLNLNPQAKATMLRVVTEAQERTASLLAAVKNATEDEAGGGEKDVVAEAAAIGSLLTALGESYPNPTPKRKAEGEEAEEDETEKAKGKDKEKGGAGGACKADEPEQPSLLQLIASVNDSVAKRGTKISGERLGKLRGILAELQKLAEELEPSESQSAAIERMVTRAVDAVAKRMDENFKALSERIAPAAIAKAASAPIPDGQTAASDGKVEKGEPNEKTSWGLDFNDKNLWPETADKATSFLED